MSDVPDTSWLHTVANMQEEIDRLRDENERLKAENDALKAKRFVSGKQVLEHYRSEEE